MDTRPTVIGALRRFLPEFLQADPPLWESQRRAIRALTHCRTPAMGGRAFGCEDCGRTHFAYHSCNHKACPQCGRQATKNWVSRGLGKLVNAPYFLVTFTLPASLRECFFGPSAKQAYDLFFAGASGALSEKLATAKGLGAQVNGFTAVLHTWNQRLEFHPHIHCLVPGAGLDLRGRPVRVRKADFLIHLPLLQAAFREHMRRLFEREEWQCDPRVWTQDWGVHIQPAGSGAAALKYLGAYVARTAITDRRILQVDEHSVSFAWKDRANHNRTETLKLPGVQFVRRYLYHVLPRGLRSIRYYGFCHPAAKAKRMRVQFHSDMPVEFGSETPSPPSRPETYPRCPHCSGHCRFLRSVRPLRGPPAAYLLPLSQHAPRHAA